MWWEKHLKLRTWWAASSKIEVNSPESKIFQSGLKWRNQLCLVVASWCMLLTAGCLSVLSFVIYVQPCAHSYIILVSLLSTFITSNQLIQVFFLCLFYHRTVLYPIISHSSTFPHYIFLNISVVLSGHGRLPDIAYVFGRIPPATHTHTHVCIHAWCIYTYM